MSQEPWVWKGTTLRGTNSIKCKKSHTKEILGIKWGSQTVSPQGEEVGRKEERLTDYLQSSGIRIAVDLPSETMGTVF